MHDLVKKVINFDNSLKVKISEKHHASKLDKPSGTALSFAKLTNLEESKIESLREGEAGNWHKIEIFNNLEELVLKHSASNLSIYAQGALNIVKWFYQKPKNLYYMHTLIEDLYE
jgi:dihydrodipicolinate reductase